MIRSSRSSMPRRQVSGVHNQILYPDGRSQDLTPWNRRWLPCNWNGEVAAVYVRNSRSFQRGNNRSEWQQDLVPHLLGLGYAVKMYDEQGCSGATLSGRDIATGMVAELIYGTVTCFVVAELSRLTRDERGFDAAYLGRLLKKYADGKLITYEKVFDLRVPSDWELYQTLTKVSAWHRREITSAMASGFARALEKGPVFRGWTKLGYKRVQLRLADGSVAVDRYGKVRTTIEKDEAQAGVMAKLAQELDQQPTLSAVSAAMNRARVPAPWKPKVGGSIWSGERISAIVADPLYAGTWRFNHGGGDPLFWQQFGREGFRPAEVEHHVPHLTWHTPAQMAGWQMKFLDKATVRRTGATRQHLLLGLLRCAECGSNLMSNGAHGYRCPKYRRGCSPAAAFSERTAFMALETKLPDFLLHTADAALADRRRQTDAAQLEIRLRLAEIEERQEYLHSEWMPNIANAAAGIVAEAQRLEVDKRSLCERRAALEAQRNLEVGISELFVLDPGNLTAVRAAIVAMAPEQKAAFFGALVNGACLRRGAKGTSPRVRVEKWSAAGQERIHAT